MTSIFHKFSSVRGRKCFVTHFENSRQAVQNLRVEWISYCNVFLPIAIGCFPASVPGPTHSGWHVHESAHGLTAIVAAGPISGQLPWRRLQPEIPGRCCVVTGFYLPRGEGRLHELLTRLLPTKLCLSVLKYQPTGCEGGTSSPGSRRQGNQKVTPCLSHTLDCPHTEGVVLTKTLKKKERREWNEKRGEKFHPHLQTTGLNGFDAANRKKMKFFFWNFDLVVFRRFLT